MEITLVNAAGESRVYSPEPLKAAANDFIKLKIDTKEPSKEEVGLDIKVETTTNDIVEEITIPAVLVAKEAPSFTFMGEASSSAAISLVEGTEGGNLNLSITAPGKIAECVLVSSFTSSVAEGWPLEIDMINGDEASLALMKSQGLDWNLSDERYANIDFTDFVKNLRRVSGENSNVATVKVTDSKGKSVAFELTFNVEEAKISLSEIPEYDMWATRAYVTVNTADGDASNLSVEMSADNGLNWTTPKMNEVSSDASSKRFEITGLVPETAYKFRAAYFSTRSAEAAGTTEAAAQVPGSGFEEWSEWEYRVYDAWLVDDTYRINYGPYASSNTKWWDCNNSETTPGDVSVAGSYDYKSFPMVTYMAGNGSSRAAQIMTIAIGDGATTSAAIFGTKVRAGRLFLGDYDKNIDNRSFVSRPSSIKFDYIYIPQGSDSFAANVIVWNGNIEIGRGSFVSSANMSSWKEDEEIEIVYNRTNLKADAISIEFLSSTAGENAPYDKKNITYAGDKTADVRAGSILTVDNLEMVY